MTIQNNNQLKKFLTTFGMTDIPRCLEGVGVSLIELS